MIYLLHISDLHLFNDPNWENMSAAIFNNVEKTLKGAGITDRLLVVTGDFHQYSVPGYELAKEFLGTLIEKMKLEPEHDVFFIPGNHDVSPSANNDLNRMNAIDLINMESTAFRRNRGNLQSNAYYEEYLKFVEEMGVYTKDEIKNGIPIKTHMRTWRNRLHLLHLNTTLVANGKSKRNQYTDTYNATEITNKGELVKGEIPSLCLGHNSFYDINENQRNQLAAAFANGYISAYLSGDKHSRIRKREEKEIPLGGDYGSIRNFVCYRSSTDEGDDYSDFGMIWHLIDENRWNANAQFWHWDINDQVELYGDEEYSYTIRHKKDEPSSTDDHDEANKRTINHNWLTTDMIRDRIQKDIQGIHAYEEAIRIKEEFQTVNTLVDTLSIPLKTADLKNTVVYGPAISCPYHGHNLEKVKLILGYIDSNGKQSLTVISAGFCDSCKAFFVREQTMKAVQEDGIPLCRAVPWKEYKKGLKSANADMHSSPYSVLSQFGYSVSEEGSPTDIQRKAILALLIYKGVIMRGSIITYLNQKDTYYKKIHPSDKSDSIWKKDELFVREFITAQLM